MHKQTEEISNFTFTLTTFINLQPRRGLVNQQTQNQFIQIQSQEESETTHLINQMNNSSLLEHTDI